MPNIMKSFLELGGDVVSTQVGDTNIASVSVSDIYTPLLGATVADSSVAKAAGTVSDSSAEIGNIIKNFQPSTDGLLVYRTRESVFKYTENQKNNGFLVPAGSKVVKLGENGDAAVVIIWKDPKYYLGIMPSSALNPTQTQNIVAPEGFLSDAKHTLFRFKRRLSKEKIGTPTAFKQRMLPQLEQKIGAFEAIFSNNPKEAAQRIKDAIEKYKPLLSRTGNKVDIVQRHLNAIFASNDFVVNGLKFSEQVRVLPLSLGWLDQYYKKDEEVDNFRGRFGGDSGEGVNYGYSEWEDFINAISYLLDTIADRKATDTPEGKWLLANINAELLDNTIKEIICIHRDTWLYNTASNDWLASNILLRDTHGPFFTSALFTVIAHELSVNDFSNGLFQPADTHFDEDIRDSVANKSFNNLSILDGDPNYEDALYRSHSYLSAISLNYILNLVLS